MKSRMHVNEKASLLSEGFKNISKIKDMHKKSNEDRAKRESWRVWYS